MFRRDPTRNSKRRVLLHLEQLEDRSVPSASPAASLYTRGAPTSQTVYDTATIKIVAENDGTSAGTTLSLNGNTLDGVQDIRIYQSVPGSSALALDAIDTISTGAVQLAYQKADGSAGSLGTVLGGNAALQTAGSLHYVLTITAADVSVQNDVITVALTATIGSASATGSLGNETITHTYRTPAVGLTTMDVSLSISTNGPPPGTMYPLMVPDGTVTLGTATNLASVLTTNGSNDLPLDALPGLTLSSMYDSAGSFSADTLSYFDQNGIPQSLALGSAIPGQNLFAQAPTVGSALTLQMHLGSAWNGDSPTVTLEALQAETTQTYLGGPIVVGDNRSAATPLSLALQGYLAASTDPSIDNLTLWLTGPASLSAYLFQNLNVSATLTATAPTNTAAALATPVLQPVSALAGVTHIDWSAVPGATSYQIDLEDVTTGTHVISITSSPTTDLTLGNQVTPTDLYAIRVRTLSLYYPTSSWSTVTDFSPPPVFAPFSSVTGTTPSVQWSASFGATAYQVTLIDVTTGAAMPVANVTAPSLVLGAAVNANDTYSIQVNAIDAQGQAGLASAVVDFTLQGAPDLTAPTPGDLTIGTNDQPIIAWSAVTNAAHYELQVDDETSGGAQVVRDAAVASNSYGFAMSLLIYGHDYRWMVRAVDATGQDGPWSAAANFTYVITPPSAGLTDASVAAPTLIGPIGDFVGAPIPPLVGTRTPNFSWTTVYNATYYEFWAADLTTNTPAIVDVHFGVPDTAYYEPFYDAPISFADGHQYAWWVRAIDPSGNVGAWSARGAFTYHTSGEYPAPLAAPTPLSPSGTVIAARPELTWTAVPGADHYDLSVDDLTANVTPTYTTNGVYDTYFALNPSVSTDGHQYRFQVRAVDSQGRVSPWSVGENFTFLAHGNVSRPLAAPTPIGPSGLYNVFEPMGYKKIEQFVYPTFSWTPVPAVAKYDFRLDDVTAGITELARGFSDTASHYIPGPNFWTDGHQYRWWVSAVDPDTGADGPWSAATDFIYSDAGIMPQNSVGNNLSPPTSIGPSGTVTGGYPTFAWQSLLGTNQFDLWIEDVTAQPTLVYRNYQITGTTLAAGANLSFLTSGHTYRWWVRQFSYVGPGQLPMPDGPATDWSDPLDFTYTAPAAPTKLTAPADSLDTTPTLSWDPPVAPGAFDVWVNDDTTGQAQIVRNTAVSGTSFTVPNPLPRDNTYTYWVRSVGSGGDLSPWSAPSTFTLTSAAPSVTSGPSGTVIGIAPTFSWSALAGADHYDLWVNDVSSNQSQVVRLTNVAGTSAQAAVSTTGDTYRWWVRAVDRAGMPAPWSAVGTFSYYTTAAPTLVGPTNGTLAALPMFSWQGPLVTNTATTAPGALAAPPVQATTYDIWVDNLSTGGTLVLRNQNVSGLSFTPSTPLAMGDSYRFWVRAVDAKGQSASPWSTPLDFTVTAQLVPTLSAPTTPSPAPTLTWTVVTGASHYDLWLDDLTTGFQEVVRVKYVTGTSYALPAGLLTNGDSYTAWVRAINGENEAGLWSAGVVFTAG